MEIEGTRHQREMLSRGVSIILLFWCGCLYCVTGDAQQGRVHGLKCSATRETSVGLETSKPSVRAERYRYGRPVRFKRFRKPTIFIIFWCFWSSNHSNTYDFLTFIMLLELKPFKNIWLCDLFTCLKLFGSHACSGPTILSDVSWNLKLAQPPLLFSCFPE